jgi:cell division septation protein DedD
MSAGGRLRFLIVGVAVLTGLFVGLSRMTGRMVSGDLASRHAESKAAHAGVADGTPDLTFYRALGSAPAPGGRRGAMPPPDPALHPAPGDVIAPGGVYVVQVLATRDEGQAKRLRDRLASKGFPAAISEDTSGAASTWRVRLGRWRDRGPAEAMAARIKKDEGLEPWVLQEAAP